jgi:hypothetical protein
MNATEGWRASWVEIVPSFALEREFSRAINEPREPLLPFGPVGTGGCTSRSLISRPKWQGDLPEPVRPGALSRIYPRTTAPGRCFV